MPIVELPTLHAGQIAAYRAKWSDGRPAKRKAIRCGRRWGKSLYGVTIACDGAAKGKLIGYFTPGYKYQIEVYNDCADILKAVRAGSNKVEGTIRTTTNGRVDFWTLEDERAGRSRKYHHVIIDEAAFAKQNAMEIWDRSIEPTLLDYDGSVTVLSNTNGNSPANFFWRICNERQHGFLEYHAPTSQNPHVPERKAGETEIEYMARRVETFAEIVRTRPALVYAQEYLAEFVSWAGVPIFDATKMLVNGEGVPYPAHCDIVFVVIDSAMKDGSEHDGTGASYWSWSAYREELICLDWEYVQVQGAFLIEWIPSVFARCEELARECAARSGSIGAYIEDAQSGTILLQQCDAAGLPAQPLPSELTAAGKDQRAINASPAVFQGKVKFSRHAHKKTTNFKGQDRNHMWHQMIDFRVADKDAAKRADDLLDTGTYAIAITHGNQQGIMA